MKNYFKKFNIMFVVSLMLVLGSCVGVFADDTDEIGTSTPNNNLVIGSELQHPEKGWKRFDDTNSNIAYDGSWTLDKIDPYYKGTMHFSVKKNNPNSSVKFKFYGSKLRIIANSDCNSCKMNINIDGANYDDQRTITNNKFETLLVNKTDLVYGVHTVILTINSESGEEKHLQLDAIDIDDTGYLMQYNTGATLIINLADGETKVFDVSISEANKFKSWYNTKSEFENKLTYEFYKTVNSSMSIEEDVVHDKITSYEIRKY